MTEATTPEEAFLEAALMLEEFGEAHPDERIRAMMTRASAFLARLSMRCEKDDIEGAHELIP